jgi:hypothetical protein
MPNDDAPPQRKKSSFRVPDTRPNAVYYAQILDWNPLKNYAVIPNPSNPHAMVLVFRRAMLPPPAPGIRHSEVLGKWLEFKLGDIHYPTSKRKGELMRAVFVPEPPMPTQPGQRFPNIAFTMHSLAQWQSARDKAKNEGKPLPTIASVLGR